MVNFDRAGKLLTVVFDADECVRLPPADPGCVWVGKWFRPVYDNGYIGGIAGFHCVPIDDARDMPVEVPA